VNTPQNKKHKKPGLLWLLFYGRRRRGFPWLLVVVFLVVLVLALTFVFPGGVDLWRAVYPIVVGALLVAALVFAIVASLRPRRRR
jgi:hypothetical protein